MVYEITKRYECIIDKQNLPSDIGIKTYNTVEEKIDCDAIIVTPLRYFFDIEEMLREAGIKNIYSMDDVLCECIRCAKKD